MRGFQYIFSGWKINHEELSSSHKTVHDEIIWTCTSHVQCCIIWSQYLAPSKSLVWTAVYSRKSYQVIREVRLDDPNSHFRPFNLRIMICMVFVNLIVQSCSLMITCSETKYQWEPSKKRNSGKSEREFWLLAFLLAKLMPILCIAELHFLPVLLKRRQNFHLLCQRCPCPSKKIEKWDGECTQSNSKTRWWDLILTTKSPLPWSNGAIRILLWAKLCHLLDYLQNDKFL